MRIRKTAENIEEIEYEIEKNLEEAKKLEEEREECSYSNFLRKDML